MSNLFSFLCGLHNACHYNLDLSNITRNMKVFPVDKKNVSVCVCLSIYSPGHGTMQGQSIPGGCPETWETPGRRRIWDHERVRHDLVTEQQIYTHNIYTVEYYSTRNPTNIQQHG